MLHIFLANEFLIIIQISTNNMQSNIYKIVLTIKKQEITCLIHNLDSVSSQIYDANEFNEHDFSYLSRFHLYSLTKL